MKKLEELKVLIPKHKQDNYYIEEIDALSDEELNLIVDDLLIWIKNMQFEVSKELVLILAKRGDLLTDKFIEHLDNEKIESVYKYNIINYVIRYFDESNLKKFEKSFKRLSNKPTEQEKYSEIDVLVKNLI